MRGVRNLSTLNLVSKNALTIGSVQVYNLGYETDAELLRGMPACDRSSQVAIDNEKPEADAGLHQAPRRGRPARRRTESRICSQIRPHLA